MELWGTLPSRTERADTGRVCPFAKLARVGGCAHQLNGRGNRQLSRARLERCGGLDLSPKRATPQGLVARGRRERRLRAGQVIQRPAGVRHAHVSVDSKGQLWSW